MDVGGGRARLGIVRPGGEERDHVVLGHRFDLGHRLRGRRRRGADRADRLGRHRPRPRVGLEHQGLHPAPELVLVGLGPDPAHLRQRVPVDHASTVSAGWLASLGAAGVRGLTPIRTPLTPPIGSAAVGGVGSRDVRVLVIGGRR